MKMFLYIVTFIGGIFGTLILFGTFLADSAPQQGAGAAVAVAFVVIPYCMARVIEKARQEPMAEAVARALLAHSQQVKMSQQPPRPTPPAEQSQQADTPHAPPLAPQRNPFAPKRP